MKAPEPFGAAFVVNTKTRGFQFEPSIEALPDGRFVAAWSTLFERSDGVAVHAIRAQIFNADGAKSGPEMLLQSSASEIGSSLRYPKVAALPNGRFVVAWDDDVTNTEERSVWATRAQIFNATGDPVGSKFLIRPGLNGNGSTFDITSLSDGSLAATWSKRTELEDSSSQWDILARVLRKSGFKVGDQFLVSSSTEGALQESAVAPLPDRRFVVAWQDNSKDGDDGSGSAIMGQLFRRDGQKIGSEFLLNTTIKGDQTEPSLASLSDGRFVAAWTDNSKTGGDASRKSIRAQIFNNDGSKFGEELLVNTTTDGSQTDPGVLALTDGRFVVAWTDDSMTDGSVFAIRAQVFDVNGAMHGGEFLISSPGEGGFDANASLLVDGRFVVAFESVDGDRTGISAQVFDPREAGVSLDGTPLDDQFIGTDFRDSVRGASGDDWLSGRSGADFLSGGVGDDRLDGDSGRDTMSGNSGSDTLFGRAGADLIQGGRGSDHLSGGPGADSLLGGAEDDTLKGGGGADRLLGAGARDDLRGGAGDDFLKGGGGSDRLAGQRGDDVLRGDGGRDRFIFRNGDGSDEIRGFEQGSDQIEIICGADEFGDLAISQLGRDVLIEFADVDVLVKGMRAGQFTGDDFVFACANSTSNTSIFEPEQPSIAAFFDEHLL